MGVQVNSGKILGYSKLTIAIFIVWGMVLIILAVAGFILFTNKKSGTTTLPNDQSGIVIEKTRFDGCIDDTIYTSVEEALQQSKPEDVCTLNLSGQNLTALPDGLSQFTNLVVLGLGDNNFTEIPVGLGELARLQNVGLTKNNISSLPQDITFLSNLKLIDLSENPISESDLKALKQSLPNTEIRYLEKMPAFIQPKE